MRKYIKWKPAYASCCKLVFFSPFIRMESGYYNNNNNIRNFFFFHEDFTCKNMQLINSIKYSYFMICYQQLLFLMICSVLSHKCWMSFRLLIGGYSEEYQWCSWEKGYWYRQSQRGLSQKLAQFPSWIFPLVQQSNSFVPLPSLQLTASRYGFRPDEISAI